MLKGLGAVRSSAGAAMSGACGHQCGWLDSTRVANGVLLWCHRDSAVPVLQKEKGGKLPQKGEAIDYIGLVLVL